MITTAAILHKSYRSYKSHALRCPTFHASDLTATLRLSDGSRPKMINVYKGPNGLTAPHPHEHHPAR